MSELCVQACDQAGWMGEAAVFLALAARAAWSEYRRRQAIAETRQIAAKNDALVQTVQALSTNPPPLRVAVPSVPTSLTITGPPPSSPRPSDPETE